MHYWAISGLTEYKKTLSLKANKKIADSSLKFHYKHRQLARMTTKNIYISKISFQPPTLLGKYNVQKILPPH